MQKPIIIYQLDRNETWYTGSTTECKIEEAGFMEAQYWTGTGTIERTRTQIRAQGETGWGLRDVLRDRLNRYLEFAEEHA